MPRYLNIVLNLLGLFLILYLGVDIFYRVVEERFVRPLPVPTPVAEATRPPGTKSVRPGDYQAILQRNIFGTKGREESPVVVEQVETLQPTTLRLSLLGTVAGEEPDARAIILDQSSKKQDLYRVGGSVQGATIRQIFRNKVVLRVNNRDEVLTMDESKKSGAPSATGQPPETAAAAPEGAPGTTAEPVTIDRADIQESLSNINQLLTQVRIRPYFKDGKAEGLIVSHLQPGSMFTTLGLQNGDIIQMIDGNPIRTPDDAIALYEHLKSGSSISIEVTRRGRQEILNYNIRE